MINSFQYNISLPIITLVLWSMFIWGWMVLTRVSAIKKANMHLDRFAPRGAQMNELPPKVRWIADNYNHLTEQSTHFYALSLLILILNLESDITLYLIWVYVVLKIVHSLVQILGNIILIRFGIFVLSSTCLCILGVFNFVKLLGQY